MGLADWLRDPDVGAVDPDSDDRLVVHGAILARKRMLREVFNEFHRVFHALSLRYFSVPGLEVELGAGVAPMRDSFPNVIATDVVDGAHLDRVLDAQQMDLPDGSVRLFYGQNCFHHLPDPDRFFSELERVLVDGGGAVLLDPYYGPLSGFVHRRLFSSEDFDKNRPNWHTPSTGPMSGVNQALSYIVFTRDREEFESKYPRLRIVHQETMGNYLGYLLSGGLNFRQLCPDWMIPAIKSIRFCLRPFDRILALHHVVVLKKVSSA